MHAELVSEKAAHARALVDNIRSQLDQKKILEEREEVARRLIEEKSKREHHGVIEELKNSIAAVTMKASEEVGAQTASLEKSTKEVEELKGSIAAVTTKASEEVKALTAREGEMSKEVELLKKEQSDDKQVVAGLRGDLERVTYDRDGLQAQLLLAHKARDKYVAAVDQVQNDVRQLQKYVAGDAASLQRQMEDHWIRMCNNLGRAMAERVIEARENQSQDAMVVASA